MLKTFFMTVLLAGCLFLLSGCASYYPVQNHPILECSNLHANTDTKSVALSFEFQSRGKFSPQVSNTYRPVVKDALKSTGLFTSINEGSSSSDTYIDVVMNNHVGSMAGAIGQGFLSGLTLGLIGTKVTDDYTITASFKDTTGKVQTSEYEYALVSTSGLIKGGVKGVKAQSSIPEAFNIILEQFVIVWMHDLQSQGLLKE